MQKCKCTHSRLQTHMPLYILIIKKVILVFMQWNHFLSFALNQFFMHQKDLIKGSDVSTSVEL